MQVPTDFAVTGWYTFAARPGDIGPAVIAGHVDSRHGPGVFVRLRELQPGDEIAVRRADGSTIRFRVAATMQFDKASFPTARVFGTTTTPALRLITCGGFFDRHTGHYLSNLVVFAVSVAARR